MADVATRAMQAPSRQAVAKRRARLRRGAADETRARDWSRAPKPTENELMLPLLATIERLGGEARPAEIYDALADAVDLDPGIRDMTRIFANGRESNLWERQVRWVRQTAKRMSLITSPARGVWGLSERGAEALGLVRPGVVVKVFEGANGESWWAQAETAVGMIPPASVDLIFTSPPYPLLVDKRGYGTMNVPDWLEWMYGLCGRWKSRLSETGSLVLNLGPVGISGRPGQSPYIERLTLALIDELGFNLMDRFYWHNPTRMPPMEWVVKRRVRCRPSVEPLLWLSPGLRPKADNRKVLEPYKTSRWLTQSFDGHRPSGFDLAAGKSFAEERGGRIPDTLLNVANSASSCRWRRAAKAAGLPAHPAVMPEAVASFFVEFLTDPGDLVYDPFMGAGTTAMASERLGRRWIGTERALSFIRGQAVRLSYADAGVDVREGA